MQATPIDAREMVRLRLLQPRAFARPWPERARRWSVIALGVAVTGYCLWKVGLFDVARLVNGTYRLGEVLAFMLPPAAHGRLDEFIYALLQTMGMAFFGTLLATAVALPLGFLGARNVIPTWILHFGLRRSFDFIRGIDVLIWALIFIHVVGLGPFSGIMALAVSDAATLAKLFGEAIENIDRKQVDGVRAAGGNGLQAMRFAVLPQVLPVILSNVLYAFESNTRSSTILGIVGAGGIGFQLQDRIRVNAWDEACFIILLILIAVAIIDFASKKIRTRLIGAAAA
jgi:phosphonate transport system permease protein